MHPPLAQHQHVACKDFIDALERCHSSNWNRLTGACNDIKMELNMCLRQERLNRRQENHDEAKLKRDLTKQKWKAIDDES